MALYVLTFMISVISQYMSDTRGILVSTGIPALPTKWKPQLQISMMLRLSRI